MKPRYEIHSIGMPDIVEPVQTAKVRAARPRRAGAVRGHGDGEPQQVRDGIRPHRASGRNMRIMPDATRARFVADVRRLSESLSRSYTRNKGDLTKAAGRNFATPGSTGLRIEHARWGARNTYAMRSAGPDKRFDTGDDMEVYVEVRTGRIVGPPGAGPSISIRSTSAGPSTVWRRSREKWLTRRAPVWGKLPQRCARSRAEKSVRRERMPPADSV